MYLQVEIFCVGFACVVDTVLLLVVLEKINRPLTAIWLKWSLLGATLWHVGSFLHALLRETRGETAMWVDAFCMSTMTGGMLLLNCGMLHAGLRVKRTGAVTHPARDWRLALVYLPVLLVIPVTVGIVLSQSRDFVVATTEFHLPFLIWLPLANLISAYLFVRYRGRLESVAAGAGAFLLKFSAGLVVITAMVGLYLLFGLQSRYEPWFRLLTNLSPLAPTLMFGWYLLRRRLLPIVFERTLVYGALLVAVILFHRLAITPLAQEFTDEFHFDFVLLEGLALVAIVLAYQPFRTRFREGLRYVVDPDVTSIRGATGKLSVEMSRRADDEIEPLSRWFVEGLQQALHVRYAVLVLRSTELANSLRFVQSLGLDADESWLAELTEANLETLAKTFARQDEKWMDCSRGVAHPEQGLIRALDLAAGFCFSYREVEGELFLGSPQSGDRLTAEQLSMVSILLDQYAATVDNRLVESARQAAQRKLFQQEKLSTLGLLAGSLAHEIKNPLSSIRTIAVLMREDVDAQSPHARDLDMIISEMDRLSDTTQELLAFARPENTSATTATAKAGENPINPNAVVGVRGDDVIQRLLGILRHLARQHDVEIVTDLGSESPPIAATETILSEILFNLIKNAIEAAGPLQSSRLALQSERSGRVTITVEPVDAELFGARPAVKISIEDNGPGIDPAVKDHLFEPFVTGKHSGTGLGLYLVGLRVKDLGGRIDCHSDEAGSRFVLQLPVTTGETT